MIMWTQTDSKGITAEVSYSAPYYEVKVFKGLDILVETFRALYAPRFGMDIDDKQESQEIAETLAQRLEGMLDV